MFARPPHDMQFSFSDFASTEQLNIQINVNEKVRFLSVTEKLIAECKRTGHH
jgi:hypothetical protein